MESILTSLAGNTSPDAVLVSWEIDHQGPLSVVLAVVIGLLLGIGAFFLYSVERRRLGIFRSIVLATLRTLVLGTILYLLLGPIIIAHFKDQRNRGVVLLVDNSMSMKQQDRRLLAEDQLRVAIAHNLMPLSTKVDKASAADLLPKLKQLPKNPERIDLVRAILQHPELKLGESVSKVGPIRPYLFGASLHAADGKEPDPIKRLLASLNANEATTNLADAVDEIVRRKDASAVIVLTDGLDTASKYYLGEVAPKCKNLLEEENPVTGEITRHDLPLHIIGIGTAEGGSLQLREVGIPDTLFENDNVQVPVRWRVRGYKEGTVELVLTGYEPFHLEEKELEKLKKSVGEKDMQALQSALRQRTLTPQQVQQLQKALSADRATALKRALTGKEIARKEVPLKIGEDLRDTFTFTPDKSWKEKGDKLEIAASIRIKEDPKVTDGAAPRPVRIADSKIKVLYIEGSPRFEFKFLQTALMRDRRIDPKFLLVNADERVLADKTSPYITHFPSTRDAFFKEKYDLVILGDVPMIAKDDKGNAKSVLTKEQMSWIQDMVSKNRGGLIVMAGRQHMPGSYTKTPIEEMLPVEFKPGRPPLNPDQRTQEYLPTLTPFGERTEMLNFVENAEENRKLWETLPGFHWNHPIVKLRPGAIPLVVNPRVKMGDQPMPVIAMHYYGKGQVIFFGTDETWRWRYNVAEKHHAKFWGQILYQMGLPHLLGDNAQRVQMALERSEAVLGQPGRIYVRLLNKDFNEIDKEEVDAILKPLDDKGTETPIKLRRNPDQKGEYWAYLENDKPGRFELRLKEARELEIPDAQPFSYRVTPPPQHELEEAGMAEELLRSAALSSGGAFYREESLHRLFANLKPRKISFFTREEIDLFPLLLTIFVLLITSEWLVRKFSDLS